MIKGSCACGAIEYEINGKLIGPITYCHCWRCRKHSGSSFGTTAEIKTSDLKFVNGKDKLQTWESSPGTHRFFASCCGSPIYKSEDLNPDVLGFRLGTLDQDPEVKVQMHYMIDAKAPWVDVNDNLSQEKGGEGPFDYVDNN